jgi:hypothetical protein
VQVLQAGGLFAPFAQAVALQVALLKVQVPLEQAAVSEPVCPEVVLVSVPEYPLD